MSMLRIGTRASKLALWQAHHVAKQLQAYGCQIHLEKISTKGDEIQDRSLMDIGGKGLFLKEIEQALLDERIDVAVHSLKDVPHTLPEGLCLAAILPRTDSGDAFVSTVYSCLADLPMGAVVGTSSLRRREQLQELRPDLQFRILRGNIDTRLKRLDDGEFAAIVLAAAGLVRLGLSHRTREILDIVPCAGQGAIAIECRTQDTEIRERLQALHDPMTACCVEIERQFLRAVSGDCKTPIGCHVLQSHDDSNTFVIQVYYKGETGRPSMRLREAGLWGGSSSVLERLIQKLSI